jgi:pimeloyl-ACP methyl ester carboxylesterase
MLAFPRRPPQRFSAKPEFSCFTILFGMLANGSTRSNAPLVKIVAGDGFVASSNPSDVDPLPPHRRQILIPRGGRSGIPAGNIEPFAPGSPSRVNDWMAAMVMDCSRRAVVAFQRAIAEADLTAEAAAIDVPVLILHGDRDATAPIDASACRYADLIPQAELVVYEDVAQGVMVTDVARLATDIVQRIAR